MNPDETAEAEMAMTTTKAKVEAGAVRKVITGNYAVSYGVLRARAQVIAAYPITPQTQIVELLSEFCAEGHLDAKFIKVESEHSAMAACIGAAAAGARAFTATSSQGLALMHELLHWAAGARLPIVMADVNRSLGPPWSVWTDQNDTLSQRDTGWLQFYCESNQEVLDTVIQAYRVSEAVLLPSMIVLDAFFLSHTSEAVEIPAQGEVDDFLPPYAPRYKLDPSDPRAFGGLAGPQVYMELRVKIQEAMEQALGLIEETDQAFRERFGRGYGLIEPYAMDDARLVLVTSGTATGTARVVIDERRARGERVGLLKVRTFRPFPAEALRRALAGAEKVVVLDRNISYGHGGIFAQEIKAALHNAPDDRPLVFGYVAGLGGRDLTPSVIHGMLEDALRHERPPADILWWGVRGEGRGR